MIKMSRLTRSKIGLGLDARIFNELIFSRLITQTHDQERNQILRIKKQEKRILIVIW